MELAQGLLKQPWRLVGLRAVAEESLLSAARLVRAFANLDQTLGSQGAGPGDRAPGLTLAPKPKVSRPRRSRSPKRDTRPPLPRPPTPPPLEARRASDRDKSESDFDEEEEDKEEEPCTEVKREDYGSRRPPEPDGKPSWKRDHQEARHLAADRYHVRDAPKHPPPSRRRHSGGKKKRRGGARHQRRYKDLQNPFRRSHRKLRPELLELAQTLEQGLSRRY